MANALVPLAQGCEELEAVTIIDILRRADINVTAASLDLQPIVASRGTKLLADTTIDEILQHDFDIVVLPGGLPGADNLNQDPRIHQILQRHNTNKKYLAAICAAPKVLATAGLLEHKTATAYPGVLEELKMDGIEISNAAVLQDGHILTSRGPGTAIDFALTIVRCLLGEESRNIVEQALQRD